MSLRIRLPRFSSDRVFYAFFACGGAVALLLATALVYVVNSGTLSRFQADSTALEAQSAAAALALHIQDRRETLEKLAEDHVFVSAVLGNGSAQQRAEKVLAALEFFSDQRRVALVNVLLEPIIDHVADGQPAPVSLDDEVMRRMTAGLIRPDADRATVTHFRVGGRDVIAIAAPVMFRGRVEGVLFGEYEYAPPPAAMSPATAFVLEASDAPAASEPAAAFDPAEWQEVRTAIAGTKITHRYFRNIEALRLAQENALWKMILALAVGLVVAFAAICAAGRSLMLNPYRALEASQSRLSDTNRELERTALHDPMTGLPNRRYLEAFLAELAAKRPALPVAVLHIDLDRFKQINDTLGHAAGDHVICEIGRILREDLFHGEFVARIGGDEFLMVAPGLDDPDEICRRAQRIVDAARRPIAFEGNLCRLGASVGVAVGSSDAPDLKQLLIDADIALYKSKDAGRNTFALFSDADAKRAGELKALADDLRRGLERGEFFPVYQPQVDAANGALVGLETLARWRHPERGVLAPSVFLKIAEDLGVLAEIDEQMLKAARRDLDALQRLGAGRPRMSVNVSARRLRDEELIAKVRDLDFAPGDLSFELLETIFLDDADEVVADAVLQLRALGIGIEIDDFGTGHASILGLANLQPDRLKIDRHFVMPALGSETNRRLI
ncbi:MAG: EAL domain-containing protein, partial [Pseudomonadota bacterium]